MVQGFAMGLAVYNLVGHHVGGYIYRSVFTLFVGVFVLWALCGNDESDRFFEENGGPRRGVRRQRGQRAGTAPSPR